MEEQQDPEFSDYLKAAFLNQYNMIIGGGLLVFAVMSGTLAIFLPIWLGIEIMLVLGLSTNENFQEWVKSEREQSAHLSQEKFLPQLPTTYRDRYLTLKSCYEDIRKTSEMTGANFDSISVWQPEIDKLSYVLSSFLRLSLYLANLNKLLSGFNKDAILLNMESAQKKMNHCSDSLRFQYQKYSEILQQRVEKAEKAGEISEAIRVQLNIIEEQFKLIQQQVFLVKNPQELTDQLDFLVSGINDLEGQGTLILDLQAELAKLTPAPPP